jgi:HipA-like protein
MTMPPVRQPAFPGQETKPKKENSHHPGESRATARRVQAVEFIRRMRGASQPCLLRCDDGECYVVKFRNNPQHVRILANEMLASRLALRIGLPVAQPAVVEVPRELVADPSFPQMEIGTRREPCAAGFQFGSRYPGAPHRTLVLDFLPDRLLRRVRNLTALFLGGFVFDKWTCNCDGRQVIFHRSGEEGDSAYSGSLIDHGFCFNDGDWNFPDNAIRSLYPRRLVYESVQGLASFSPFLASIENLEAADLEDCVKGIPEEWCGNGGGKLYRLIEQLHERRRKLRQAIIDAKNCDLRPFPNWS